MGGEHSLTSLPSGATLRSMQLSDLDAVLAIERRVQFHPWRREHFENSLKAGYLSLLLEKDGELLSYALASIGGGQADLLNIAVAPEWQRRGLATAILGQLIALIRPRADSLFLEVRASNQAAIELYEGLGFNQVGLRRNYYPAAKGREDALILALVLEEFPAGEAGETDGPPA